MNDNIFQDSGYKPEAEQLEGESTEVSTDIDELFGVPSEDSEATEGALPTEAQAFEGSATEKQPDYSGMTHEELARMFQSKFDKAQAELQKIKPKAEKADSLETFVNELYENQEVRRAFLAQLEPDLVKPKDPYAALEEQLKKEFGEDFYPDDDEAKKPLTPSWRYYKRLDDLYDKAKSQQNVQLPKTLEQIRTEREAFKEQQRKADSEMKNKVLATMKWSDNDYKSFAGWVYKLSALDLAKIYNYAQTRKSGAKAPNLAAQSGSRAHTPNEIASELKRFFG